MSILVMILIAYGVSAALYAFRMALKYFQYLEGHVRNGTIITNAIAAGLIWPITLVLDGVRGTWEEIGPVKIMEQPEQRFHEGTETVSTLPAPPQSIADIVHNNSLENLVDPRTN